MNNYHYIIAGLPELMPDFHAEGFSYKDLELAIREQLSAHDRRLVDWLDFGTDTTHLSGHFYRAVSRQKSGFRTARCAMPRWSSFRKRKAGTQGNTQSERQSPTRMSFLSFRQYSNAQTYLSVSIVWTCSVGKG